MVALAVVAAATAAAVVTMVVDVVVVVVVVVAVVSSSVRVGDGSIVQLYTLTKEAIDRSHADAGDLGRRRAAAEREHLGWVGRQMGGSAGLWLRRRRRR